jgi:hypothetical protein
MGWSLFLAIFSKTHLVTLMEMQPTCGVVPHVLELGDQLLAEVVVDGRHLQVSTSNPWKSKN